MLLVACAFDENVPIVAFAALLVLVRTIEQPVQLKSPLKSTLPPLM